MDKLPLPKTPIEMFKGTYKSLKSLKGKKVSDFKPMFSSFDSFMEGSLKMLGVDFSDLRKNITTSDVYFLYYMFYLMYLAILVAAPYGLFTLSISVFTCFMSESFWASSSFFSIVQGVQNFNAVASQVVSGALFMGFAGGIYFLYILLTGVGVSVVDLFPIVF